MSKKMFSTEDDETKTNERINDKYRNCILINCLAERCSYVSSDLTNQSGVHSDNNENMCRKHGHMLVIIFQPGS